VTIIEAKRTIFARWFRGPSWKAWEVFLCTLFGLAFEDDASFEIFKRHTGRTVRPAGPFTEAYAICGRRAGKSLIAALIVAYLAVFRNYSAVTVPGETVCAMLLGPDKKQAAILLKYVNAFFTEIPLLAQLVASRTAETISLSNGVTIVVTTSDYRSVRGYTIAVAVADELAFWPAGDAEVLDALRPGMSTIPGALFLGLSSPYSKRGVLWENFRDYYAKDDLPC
jgi:phage terminase large subunit-like protein